MKKVLISMEDGEGCITHHLRELTRVYEQEKKLATLTNTELF